MIRLIVDYGNVRERTGTGTYAWGLVDALRRHAASEVEVSEAAVGRRAKHLRPILRLQYLWRLRRMAGENFQGADVVHFVNVYVPGRKSTAAYLVTIHDIDPLEHPELYTRRYVLYFGHAVERALRRSKVVITTTEAVRGVLLNRYRLPAEKVVVTGVGLNPAFVEASARVSSTPPPLPTLLFVGSLTRKKNVRWMLDAIVAGVASGALPKMKVILAGTPAYGFQEIREGLSRAGDLAEWVHTPDALQLARLYKSSSALILPSRCEGFGSPLLEAMSCGLPIVASKIPPSVEVAGDAATFFDLDDTDSLYHAILHAVHDPQREERMKKAEARVRRYAWEQLIPRFVDTYRTACAKERFLD